MTDVAARPGIISDPSQTAARARLLHTAGADIAAALAGRSGPVDAGTLALCVAIARGKRRAAQLGTDNEIHALAEAVLALAHALASAWAMDRSAPYAAGEPDRLGQAPPAGDAWLTPREIAEGVLPFLAVPPAPAATAAEKPNMGASNGP